MASSTTSSASPSGSSGWQTTASSDAVMLDRPSGQDDRITCLGATPSSPVVLIGETPITGEAVPYFEVTLLEGSSIVVGLVDKARNNDGGGGPGKRLNSLGLMSNGDMTCTVPGSECSLPFSAPFGMLDTVGIGCQKLTRTDLRIFATHNGRDLGTILETKMPICPLYPAISFEDTGCIVTVKKTRPFLFELPPGMLPDSAASSPAQTQSAPPPPAPVSTTTPSTTSPSMPAGGAPSWHTTFSSSSVGRKLSRMFNPAVARSSRLEADLLEAQEHISVLATVLSEQDQRNQDDLLRELSVSCRRLLVRHANLVREATDDESLNRILALNDRIIELLASADQVLERRGVAGPAKLVNPTNAESHGGNLVARGTADTVSEMLFMLRSGPGRSQKNAAQCLARLVKERTHNEMVVINGGVHAFLSLSKPDQPDEELRKLAAKALAELASWIRMPWPLVDDGSLATTRGVFKAELHDVFRTLAVIVDDDPLLVSQAVSNLVLLMTTTGKSISSSSAALAEHAAPLFLRILQSCVNQQQDRSPSHGGSTSSAAGDAATTANGHTLVRQNSAHRRAMSWTGTSSSSPASTMPASSPPPACDEQSSKPPVTQRRQAETLMEASRIAAFGLSLLVRRSDSSRTSTIVNHPQFFPVLERLLTASSAGDDENELLLHGVACMKGLLWSTGDDGFSQGFITARVLQSQTILESLWRLALDSQRMLKGNLRHHLVASLSALVQHKSVLKALLETVPLSDVVDSLFVLVNQVLDEAKRNMERRSGGGSDAPNQDTMFAMDESGFFNMHFRQQQQQLNVREFKTRARFSQIALTPAAGSSSSSSQLRKNGSENSVHLATASHVAASSSGAVSEPLPCLAWELHQISMDIYRVLSTDEVNTASSTVINAIQFESIIALSQLESVFEPSRSTSSIEAYVTMSDEEQREYASRIRRTAANILVIVADGFTIPDPEAVAAGLLSLCKSSDEEVRLKAVTAIADATHKSRELALQFLWQDCAMKLCSLETACKPSSLALRPAVASALSGLAKIVFSPAKDTADCDWSLHGFGANEPAIRFLLHAVEEFDADPATATEACKALSIACGCTKPSALATHYRCAVMKRVFFHVSQMSSRCSLMEGRAAAEDLFKQCGFSLGALQVVANDPHAIREWGSVKVDVDISQLIVDHAVHLLAEFAWTASPQPTPFPFYDEHIDRAVANSGVATASVTTAPSPPMRMPLKASSSSSSTQSAPAAIDSSSSSHWPNMMARPSSPPLPSFSLPSTVPGTTTSTASPSLQRFFSDGEGISSAKKVPQMLLSTVSDLKQHPPSRWLEVVAHGLGQGETYEKIAREVRESDSKTKMAASIFRVLASPGATSSSLASAKPLVDFYAICLGINELAQYQAVAQQPFTGMEATLPPLTRDLLLKSLHGVGPLQRFLLHVPAAFAVDDDDLELAGARPRSELLKTSLRSSHPDLPFLPFRAIRLQTNVNYWAEKLIQRIIGEWALFSRQQQLGNKSGSVMRWALVLPGTAVGESEDDKNRLTDVLYSCPAIISLVFSGKHPQQHVQQAHRNHPQGHRASASSPTPSLTELSTHSNGGGASSMTTGLKTLDSVPRLTSIASTVSSVSSGGDSFSEGTMGTTLSTRTHRPAPPPPPLPSTSSSASPARLVREQEERLAQFMVNLPSTITWLTFDRDAISAEGLRLVSAFLGVRQAGLVGCAVTNSSYTQEEFSDFLRFLAKSHETMRFLDLSGNSRLWDAGCAAVCQAFVGRNLTALDLSGTTLTGGHGTYTVDVLLGVESASTSASLSRDAKGEARLHPSGLLYDGRLRYLSLARCGVSAENASRLLYALSKRRATGVDAELGLRVLNLDCNPGLKNLRQPLVSFLAFDTTVREFGAAEMDIAPFVADVARALAGNKSLQVFRYACIQPSSIPAASTPSITPLSSSSAPGALTTTPPLQHPQPFMTKPLSPKKGDVKYFIKQIEATLRNNRMEWSDAQRSIAMMLPATPTKATSAGFSAVNALAKRGQEMEESKLSEDDDEAAEVESPHNTSSSKLCLNVLFASPLVWRDDSGQLLPLDALDCDSERQILITSFDEARARKGYAVASVDVSFDFGCTSDTLISVLTRKPTSLHLSAHGESSYIVMEDGKGGMHPVRIAQLKEILLAADCSSFLQLAFVSACNSNYLAEAFVGAGVRNVVAVDSRISDKAAQVFTRAFYLSIALGDPIASAFKLAREAVRSSPLLNEPSQQSGNNFVLLGDGKEIVFPRRNRSKTLQAMPRPQSLSRFIVDFPDPKKWRLTDAKFLEVLVPGRNVDAYLTIVALSCKRVVTVSGPEGFGKSAILSGFVCKYLNERRTFEDGVVVLDLAGCRAVGEVQSKLVRLVRKPSSASMDDQIEELEGTIVELSKRRCVLILDNVDAVLEESFDELRFFLGHVLDRTKGVRLLIATRRSQPFSIPGHDDILHTLAPLSFVDSARLFLKCCPHYHNDLHVRPRQGAPASEDFLYGLARHPICAQMNGVAKNIVQMASMITYAQWTEIVEEVTEALIPGLESDGIARDAGLEEEEEYVGV